jgi:hypothetical protein
LNLVNHLEPDPLVMNRRLEGFLQTFSDRSMP